MGHTGINEFQQVIEELVCSLEHTQEDNGLSIAYVTMDILCQPLHPVIMAMEKIMIILIGGIISFLMLLDMNMLYQ